MSQIMAFFPDFGKSAGVKVLTNIMSVPRTLFHGDLNGVVFGILFHNIDMSASLPDMIFVKTFTPADFI